MADNLKQPRNASDPSLIAEIVNNIKSTGVFDEIRQECLSDVDTKPSYQNLRQRVEGFSSNFLSKIQWRSDLNKNQTRDNLRTELNNSGMMAHGLDHLIEQVVNQKIQYSFLPKVRNAVYDHLNLPRPQEIKNVPGYPFNVPPPNVKSENTESSDEKFNKLYSPSCDEMDKPNQTLIQESNDLITASYTETNLSNETKLKRLNSNEKVELERSDSKSSTSKQDNDSIEDDYSSDVSSVAVEQDILRLSENKIMDSKIRKRDEVRSKSSRKLDKEYSNFKALEMDEDSDDIIYKNYHKKSKNRTKCKEDSNKSNESEKPVSDELKKFTSSNKEMKGSKKRKRSRSSPKRDHKRKDKQTMEELSSDFSPAKYSDSESHSNLEHGQMKRRMICEDSNSSDSSESEARVVKVQAINSKKRKQSNLDKRLKKTRFLSDSSEKDVLNDSDADSNSENEKGRLDNLSDVTVSSVHTSDLSSYDERISLSSADELDLNDSFVQKVLPKIKQDREAHSKMDITCKENSKIPIQDKVNSTSQLDKNNKRRRRPNPKYSSEMYTLIFKKDKDDSIIGEDNVKSNVNSRSEKKTQDDKCKNSISSSNNPCDDESSSSSSSSDQIETSKRISHASTSSQRYNSSDLYKPRPLIHSNSRRRSSSKD